MKAKAILVAGLAALSASTASAQDIKLKFAVFGSPTNPINKCGPQRFMDTLAKASNGRLTWEVFYGASGFSTPGKLYEQVQRGVTDVSWGLPDYTPGRFPMTELISLPFVVNDSLAAARAVTRIFPKYLVKEYGAVHVISMTMVSPYQFHIRKALDKPDNLSGLRLRAAGKSTKEALEALGAAVASLPAPLTYENLQKGVIDGTVGTWAMLIAFKISEVTTHHVAANFASLPLFLVMNPKSYQALPADLRAVVDGFATPEASAEFARCFTQVDEAAIALAKKAGHDIHILSDDERRRMLERVQPVIEAQVSAVEAKGLPARAFFKDLRAAIQEEEARK